MDMYIGIEGWLSLDDIVPDEISNEVAYYLVRSVIHLADVLKNHYHDQIMDYAQGYATPESCTCSCAKNIDPSIAQEEFTDYF